IGLPLVSTACAVNGELAGVPGEPVVGSGVLRYVFPPSTWKPLTSSDGWLPMPPEDCAAVALATLPGALATRPAARGTGSSVAPSAWSHPRFEIHSLLSRPQYDMKS